MSSAQLALVGLTQRPEPEAVMRSQAAAQAARGVEPRKQNRALNSKFNFG
jgi:hypothetical protein